MYNTHPRSRRLKLPLPALPNVIYNGATIYHVDRTIFNTIHENGPLEQLNRHRVVISWPDCHR